VGIVAIGPREPFGAGKMLWLIFCGPGPASAHGELSTVIGSLLT